jgi:hypothetical protein
MGGDKLVSSLHILGVAPTLRQGEFLLRGQHGEFADLLEIPRQVALRGDVQDGRGHGRLLSPAAMCLPGMAQDRGEVLTETSPDAGRDLIRPGDRPQAGSAASGRSRQRRASAHVDDHPHTGLE